MSGNARARTGTRRVALLAALLGTTALLAAPSPAPAQTGEGGLGAEGALTAGTVAGSEFEDIGFGVGGELGVRYALSPRFSVGLSGHASWHDADDLDGSLRLLGAFLEPRYRLPRLGGGLRPFLGTRLGLAQWTVTESGEGLTADVNADGLQAGGVAGVGYPIAEGTRLQVAAVGSFLSFDDAEVEATVGEREREPFVREGSDTSGSFLGVRALLQLRLP